MTLAELLRQPTASPVRRSGVPEARTAAGRWTASPRRAAAPQKAPGTGTAARRAWTTIAGWPATVAGCTAAVLLVGLSFRFAALGMAPNRYYVTFWVGIVPAVLLLARHLVSTRSTTAERLFAIGLFGAITAVPKFLRNPTGPAYHDEYAHWRETVDVLADGRLFHPNAVIPIVEYFPGTSALTATVARLTGVTAWQAGELTLFATHLFALFAVYVAAQACLGSARAGGIAALVYGLNPSAMYFDTQFAYEGIAIAFYLWVIALVAVASREGDRRRRTGLVIAATLCAAGAIVTHHLTTVFLLLTLLGTFAVIILRPWRTRRVVGGAGSPLPPREYSRQVWYRLAVGSLALAVIWVAFVARPTLDYLSPYFGTSLKQLATIASAKHNSGGRTLLVASAEPLWERALTALAPLLMGLVCLRGLVVLRRGWRALRSDLLALMMMGLLYFPSVPFLLAPMGAEGARRSWAFFYLGLSLMVAYVLTRTTLPRRLARLPRWSIGAAGYLALTVVLIGNVGGGLNDPYRFPGPFRWGTDTRSASLEAQTVARDIATALGPVKVVTERYTGLQVIGYGGLRAAAPSAGFPAWELTQKNADPTASLAGMLYSSHFDYLVIDIRMAQEPAFNGDNYGPLDPLAGQATPMSYLDRLDHARWATRIMSSDHLRVYRLDLPLLATTVRGAR